LRRDGKVKFEKYSPDLRKLQEKGKKRGREEHNRLPRPVLKKDKTSKDDKKRKPKKRPILGGPKGVWPKTRIKTENKKRKHKQRVLGSERYFLGRAQQKGGGKTRLTKASTEWKGKKKKLGMIIARCKSARRRSSTD